MSRIPFGGGGGGRKLGSSRDTNQNQQQPAVPPPPPGQQQQQQQPAPVPRPALPAAQQPVNLNQRPQQQQSPQPPPAQVQGFGNPFPSVMPFAAFQQGGIHQLNPGRISFPPVAAFAALLPMPKLFGCAAKGHTLGNPDPTPPPAQPDSPPQRSRVLCKEAEVAGNNTNTNNNTNKEENEAKPGVDEQKNDEAENASGGNDSQTEEVGDDVGPFGRPQPFVRPEWCPIMGQPIAVPFRMRRVCDQRDWVQLERSTTSFKFDIGLYNILNKNHRDDQIDKLLNKFSWQPIGNNAPTDVSVLILQEVCHGDRHRLLQSRNKQWHCAFTREKSAGFNGHNAVLLRSDVWDQVVATVSTHSWDAATPAEKVAQKMNEKMELMKAASPTNSRPQQQQQQQGAKASNNQQRTTKSKEKELDCIIYIARPKGVAGAPWFAFCSFHAPGGSTSSKDHTYQFVVQSIDMIKAECRELKYPGEVVVCIAGDGNYQKLPSEEMQQLWVDLSTFVGQAKPQVGKAAAEAAEFAAERRDKERRFLHPLKGPDYPKEIGFNDLLLHVRPANATAVQSERKKREQYNEYGCFFASMTVGRDDSGETKFRNFFSNDNPFPDFRPCGAILNSDHDPVTLSFNVQGGLARESGQRRPERDESADLFQ